MALSLKFVALPSGWDAGELARLQLGGGSITYEQLIRDIDDALGAAAGDLLASYVGTLLSVTNEAAIDYSQGAGAGFTRRTERGRGDGRKQPEGGHMLPLVGYDHPLDWTYDFLKQARPATIYRQVDGLINATKSIVARSAFTRLFKLEEETGAYYGLGNSGVSVPWADGGNGTIGFTPISVPDRGGTFASTHNHFLRLDGINQANLEAAVLHLWEHGIDGPFDLLVAQADLADWQNTANVTGWVEKPDPVLTYGSGETVANVGGDYIGGVKTKYGFCRMVANGRIPTGYWSVTKTYGADDPMNPLRLRSASGAFMPELVVENVGHYPLQGAVPRLDFGVGVGESRVAAVCVKNAAAGSYDTPTIS